jgi:hypothetical protein
VGIPVEPATYSGVFGRPSERSDAGVVCLILKWPIDVNQN